VKLPHVKLPHVKLPHVKLPHVKLPHVKLPCACEAVNATSGRFAVSVTKSPRRPLRGNAVTTHRKSFARDASSVSFFRQACRRQVKLCARGIFVGRKMTYRAISCGKTPFTAARVSTRHSQPTCQLQFDLAWVLI
jgi:hypothetical protein